MSAMMINPTSSQKHKENHKISADILDDLSSRFIINVPIEERSDFIRICFQIELAHWFYLDFYCSAEDTRLVPCGIKQFAYHIFHHIPFLKEHLHRLNDIMNEFKVYKMSVPTYGAILMTGDQQRVLLVQSFLAKSSWGFPKGKVNEDEEPLHCAIREVYEETGFDIAKLIGPDAYIEGVLNYQYTRLYIVPNVPADTVFAPRTRGEIKACRWFKLDLLPTHKMDPVCKEKLGINANSFFMIMPFVKRLKRFVADQRSGATTTVAAAAAAAAVRTSSKNNNYQNNNGGQQQQVQQMLLQQQQRRQRHKSLGDLDGMKTTPTVGGGGSNTTTTTTTTNGQNINAQQHLRQQQHYVQQGTTTVAAATTSAVNSNNTTTRSGSSSININNNNNNQKNNSSTQNPTSTTTTTTTINNKQQPQQQRIAAAVSGIFDAKPAPAAMRAANFKRQLFTLQQQQQQQQQASTASSAQHHSDPLAVAQRVSGHQTPATTTTTTTNTMTTTGDSATEGSPRVMRKTNKKRRPIASFLHGLNGDPALHKWRQFAFVVRPDLLAPAAC